MGPRRWLRAADVSALHTAARRRYVVYPDFLSDWIWFKSLEFVFFLAGQLLRHGHSSALTTPPNISTLAILALGLLRRSRCRLAEPESRSLVEGEMTPAPRAPQTVSAFLRSYSSDVFEWESHAYEPRTNFVWSKPPAPFSSRILSASSTYHDAAPSDGRSSPGAESLSDMSISLSDAGSGILFSIPPPMIRTRATSLSSSRSLIPSSGSSSLSDMSISPAPSISSQSPEDFEQFAGDMRTQRSRASLVNAAFPEHRLRRRDFESIDCGAHASDDMDSEAVVKILEWAASLFTSVASSALDYTIRPTGADRGRSQGTPSFESEEWSLSPQSKDSDPVPFLPPSKIVVKINSSRTKGPLRPIQPYPAAILMPGAINYEAINPEQHTTAKPVCMWGRRLERIPKVRLAGQEEAVYCFDSRKQRQKQKGPVISVPPTCRQVTGDHVPKEQQRPTQIFYRARPLGTPLVRRDLPATPVDAVKITQGQVLLQHIAPVRFNPPPPCRDSEREPCRRSPFTSRSNWGNTGYRTEDTPSSLLLKKIPGRGFL